MDAKETGSSSRLGTAVTAATAVAATAATAVAAAVAVAVAALVPTEVSAFRSRDSVRTRMQTTRTALSLQP